MYNCWSYSLKRLLIILKCWVWSDSLLKVVRGRKIPYTASDWMLLLNSHRFMIGLMTETVQMMRGQEIYLISACTLPRHSLLRHCRCVGILFFSWHIETWKQKTQSQGAALSWNWPLPSALQNITVFQNSITLHIVDLTTLTLGMVHVNLIDMIDYFAVITLKSWLEANN